MAILAPRAAQGVCNNNINLGITPNVVLAHIGDTNTFTVTIDNSTAGNCDVSNVVVTLTFPDGSSEVVFTRDFIPGGAGSQITCPDASNPDCTTGPYLYVIQQADLQGQPLNGYPCSASTNDNVSGLPKVAITHDNLTGTAQFGSGLTGAASGCKAAVVTVITPCISVTKNCVDASGPTAPIDYDGTVANCGDTTLFGVTLVEVNDSTTNTLLSLSSLAAGASTNYSGNYLPTTCPSTDFVTASGTDQLGKTVTAETNATCNITIHPNIAVTKTCHNATAGQPITFDGTVTNSGDVALINVVAVDVVDGATNTVLGPLTLDAGASTNYSGQFTPASCPDTDEVFVSGSVSAEQVACIIAGSAGTNATVTASSGPQTCGIPGTPSIHVTKTCELLGNCDNPLIGATITVTNNGDLALNSVSVVDDQIGTLLTGGSLDVGASMSFTTNYLAVNNPSTNNVTASGTSVGAAACGGSSNVSSQASCVVPISGTPCIHVTKTCAFGDSANTNVTFEGTVSNCGTDITLTDVTVVEIDETGTNTVLTLASLAPGASTNFSGSYAVTGGCTVEHSDTVVATGTDDTICAPPGGRTVTDQASCQTPICQNGCRTTGGGKQPSNNTCPTVRYVTHGGQVGAPFAQASAPVIADCGTISGTITLASGTFNNPCIRGEYQHVRHIKGGLMGTFHAASNGNEHDFDSLQCACLPCDDYTESFPAILGASTGCHVADRTYHSQDQVINGLCNSGIANCGPLPRKAPANKIAFSGVGDYTMNKGKKAPLSVVFRVEIEDRGEPGGAHPIAKAGKLNPPDRYRMRMWFITGDPNSLANLRLRAAVAVTDATTEVVAPTMCDGTPTPAPDIDDGGDLDRGNRQIHPLTGALCQ